MQGDEIAGEAPQIIVSNSVNAPNVIKIRKEFDFQPVTVKLGVNLDRMHRQIVPILTLKEQLLKGRVCLDLGRDRVSYKRRYKIQNGGHIGIKGGFDYKGLVGRYWHPQISLCYEVGRGKAYLRQDAIDIKQKAYFHKNAGIEVCGSLQVPAPPPEYTSDAAEMKLRLQRLNAFQIHLAQCNAIFRL